MIPEDLTGLLTDVRRLRRGFAGTAPQQWTATTAAAELTVQLGHLALCLLHRRRADTTDFDDPQRPITNVGDELADHLDLDLLAEFRAMVTDAETFLDSRNATQ